MKAPKSITRKTVLVYFDVAQLAAVPTSVFSRQIYSRPRALVATNRARSTSF